ncbi:MULTISPECIES: S8 family peptidase [Chryseobacterium]|uniref:S8 family peptidase n=1 Tax=Chryseobacterium TaxID=59732 RepID=UPI00195DA906|nr:MULTISPECIES: S8 family serine peptidase [Chryseobacterium]MBM7417637.1 subtilisin family serine protease [Chryseobacterium sp. JUb44]MDH6211830.1 subtilisin family serine protease [Chryseobacterium sp. BIGb0186]WSO10466.1 S8 family serine peptidase [Chryseobacterium scophthalmum]
MEKERYIVLLRNQEKSALKKVEKELQVSITSSENLSKENRSFQVIDEDNSVLYKNLGVMVVENMDEHQLAKAMQNESNPIVYFEKERDFFPADEMKIISELKKQSAELSDKIIELEKFINNKPIPAKNLVEMEWGIKSIGIERALYTGKGIDVCILDTGLEMSHPDFSSREIEGKSFIQGEDWSKDPNGHGTHCTGISAGNLRSDTGKRYGIAKDCNLKIAKVLSDKGKGTTSSVIDAIDWAITKKFRILSLSLASPVSLNEKPSVLFEAVGMRALENNCLIIAAAGNDSNRPSLPKPVSAPANSLSIMAVAAIDGQMRVAKFSNGGLNPSTGGNINVCAPGVDIFSSYPKNTKNKNYYFALSGTSMATPHVSGLAALYMEQFPDLSAKEIWELIEKNAKPIEGLKYRDIGSGLIQII